MLHLLWKACVVTALIRLLRLLECRSRNRQIAEEQQESLRRLHEQRLATEQEFMNASVENIRRRKQAQSTAALPTPCTPYRLARNILMTLPFGNDFSEPEPQAQVCCSLSTL